MPTSLRLSRRNVNRPNRRPGSRRALYHKLSSKTMAYKALCFANFLFIIWSSASEINAYVALQRERKIWMNRDIRTLKYLASMPFLDRLELAAVSDVPDRTMHDVVAGLKAKGLVSWVRHSTEYMASTRRLYVTRKGLQTLADQLEVHLLDLIRVLSGLPPLAAQPSGTTGCGRRHIPAGNVGRHSGRRNRFQMVPQVSPGRRHHARRRARHRSVEARSHHRQDGLLQEDLAVA